MSDYRPSTPLNNKQAVLMFVGMAAMVCVGWFSATWGGHSPLWFKVLCVVLGSAYYRLTQAIVRLR